MTFSQGMIVLVPFPFTDLSTSKKRPVLILSRTSDINLSDDLITCAITSHDRNIKNSLKITNSSLSEGSLPKTSFILVSKLFTIEKSLIINKFGKINENNLVKVKKIFRELV